MQFGKLAIIAAVIAVSSVVVRADVIWDEQLQGDLRPETDPTTLNIPLGDSDVLGNIGGDPNDPLQDAYDAFVFEVGPGETWSQFTLVAHDPNPPNQTTGIVIYEGSNSVSGVFLNGAPVAGPNVNIFDLLSLGPFGAGTYTVGIRDFESLGNLYHLRVQLVPEPSALTLALLTFIAGGLMRRRLARSGLRPSRSPSPGPFTG
jgi:hypothetical protein